MRKKAASEKFSPFHLFYKKSKKKSTFENTDLSQKYFILKLNLPNADEIIKSLEKSLESRGNLQAEKVEDNAVRLLVDSETSLDILKDISNNFIEELLKNQTLSKLWIN